uniref:Uncharacterized protein n=1 Tax=Rhizophora mucronata TaxID=61149 RepID=A0A2P2P2V9_RHIMU
MGHLVAGPQLGYIDSFVGSKKFSHESVRFINFLFLY